MDPEAVLPLTHTEGPGVGLMGASRTHRYVLK